MNDTKKQTEEQKIEQLEAECQVLRDAFRYWFPDETMIPKGHEAAWNNHVRIFSGTAGRELLERLEKAEKGLLFYQITHKTDEEWHEHVKELVDANQRANQVIGDQADELQGIIRNLEARLAASEKARENGKVLLRRAQKALEPLISEILNLRPDILDDGWNGESHFEAITLTVDECRELMRVRHKIRALEVADKIKGSARAEPSVDVQHQDENLPPAVEADGYIALWDKFRSEEQRMAERGSGMTREQITGASVALRWAYDNGYVPPQKFVAIKAEDVEKVRKAMVELERAASFAAIDDDWERNDVGKALNLVRAALPLLPPTEPQPPHQK